MSAQTKRSVLPTQPASGEDWASNPVMRRLKRVFEGHVIRVQLDEERNPWFIAADVCRALGHSNPRMAVQGLDEDERNTVRIAYGIRGNPFATGVSESGLYSLIVRSRAKNARRFRRWVTHEVLPEIRRLGDYVDPEVVEHQAEKRAMEALDDNETLCRLLVERLGEIERQKQVIAEQAATLEEQAPKVHLHDAILDTSSTFGFREAAKLIREATGVKEPGFRDYLISASWAYRLAGRLVPKHYGLEHGFVVSRERPYSDPNTGETKAAVTLRITQKGISHAIRKLSEAA